MKPASFQSSSLFSSSIIVLLVSVVSMLSNAYSDHKPYDKCAPFSCGNIKNIRYPFWGNGQPEYCGQPGFRIDCEEEEQTATMIMMNLKYHVIEINPDSQLLRIARIDLTNKICPDENFNSILNFTLFSYTSNDENATLFYDCHLSEDRKTANTFTCLINNIRREARLVSHLISGDESELGCNTSVSIPILARAVVGFLKSELTVIQVLKEGFEVRWIIDQLKCRNCAKNGGRCGYNWTVDQFSCFRPSGSAELTSAEASSGMHTF
ncbi:Protein kinase superfamily protein [Euphorbia peplus]|nr:Protein kinase superfamily protein [Euphorbia peplus]